MREIVLVATLMGCTITGCAASRANLASPVVEDDCGDGDKIDDAVRGAMWGAGGSFLLSGMITGFGSHTVYIGLAGAVGGFLGGLTEVESCRRPPE